jgi:hypothetical protein
VVNSVVVASSFGSVRWCVAGTLAAAGALGCAGNATRDEGQRDCGDPENLRLWTLDIDHPDYVTLKNTGSCPVELEGLHLVFDDRDDAFALGVEIDCTLELPALALPAGASVRVSELPLPGDIDARTVKFEGCMYDLPFFPDRGGVTYLCRGGCAESTLLDLVAHQGDEFFPTYRDPPALRYGARFDDPVGGVTLLNSQWARFQRIATDGSNWGLANLILSADFEGGVTAETLDGKPLPWSTIPRDSTEILTTDETAMSGVSSLRITHRVESEFSTELSQSFEASSMPRDIAYFARLSSESGGYFEVLSQLMPALRIAFGPDGLGAAMSDAHAPFTRDTWYLVELRDVDWIARHFDLYVDGVLVGRHTGISSNANLPDEVRLFTYGAGSAYYDAIELWGLPAR